MAEGAAEEISCEADLVFGEPDDQRVVGLGARYGDQLDVDSAQGKTVAILEGTIWRVQAGGLSRDDRVELLEFLPKVEGCKPFGRP